jgi:uncharacterized protein (TIGR02996 family)
MPKTDASFLKDIFANPGDDAPRHVYRDWLLERGDPRGTFLSLQYGHKDEDQEALLLKRHAKLWLGPLVPLGFKQYLLEAGPRQEGRGATFFQRGFPVAMMLSTTEATIKKLTGEASLATLEWITVDHEIRFSKKGPALLAAFLAHPVMKALRGVSVPAYLAAAWAKTSLGERLEEVSLIGPHGFDGDAGDFSEALGPGLAVVCAMPRVQRIHLRWPGAADARLVRDGKSFRSAPAQAGDDPSDRLARVIREALG